RSQKNLLRDGISNFSTGRYSVDGNQRVWRERTETELAPEKASWLDVRTIARVEVTSEDWRYPIESAFDEIDEGGWRADERGKQNIRLFFDEPPRIRRIWLRFIELEAERTQQFTLQWSKDKTDALRPL